MPSQLRREWWERWTEAEHVLGSCKCQSLGARANLAPLRHEQQQMAIVVGAGWRKAGWDEVWGPIYWTVSCRLDRDWRHRWSWKTNLELKLGNLTPYMKVDILHSSGAVVSWMHKPGLQGRSLGTAPRYFLQRRVALGMSEAHDPEH